MDLVSKPQSSAPVWEHFGFKPNERGEPINVNEPVCRLCLKTVATKRGNTTNLKSHLKHNHPTQFFNLGTTTAAGAGEGSSRQLSVTDAFSRQCKYKRDSAKWRTLTDSVTRYIAKEMQPLNTVEKPAFKNMLQTFLFIIKCSLKECTCIIISDAPIMIFRGRFRYRFFSSKLADSDTDFFSFKQPTRNNERF